MPLQPTRRYLEIPDLLVAHIIYEVESSEPEENRKSNQMDIPAGEAVVRPVTASVPWMVVLVLRVLGWPHNDREFLCSVGDHCIGTAYLDHG